MLKVREPEIFLSGMVGTVEDRPAGQTRFGEREAGRAIEYWKFGPDADSSVAVFLYAVPRMYIVPTAVGMCVCGCGRVYGLP